MPDNPLILHALTVPGSKSEYDLLPTPLLTQSNFTLCFQGGELFDKIIEKKRLTEAEAKVYFYQGQCQVVF